MLFARPFMKARCRVRIVLIVLMMLAALACGLWDVVCNARGHPEHQISAVALEWARAFPILPLMLGVLLGHLFWPQMVNNPVIANLP
jgi:hypothetical protein